MPEPERVLPLELPHTTSAAPADLPFAEGGAGVGSSGRVPGWLTPFRVVVVAIVVVASVLTWALTGASAPGYRTATAALGTAVSSLDSVGTITPTNQASLRFSVAGTVAGVSVSVGQQVSGGQTVATLETAPLEATVVTEQASLAGAELTLANDEASQTASTSTSTVGQGAASGSSGTNGQSTSGSGQPTGSAQQIATLQGTLVADQKVEDQDSLQATADMRAANAACGGSAPATPGPGGSPPPTTVPGGTGGPQSCSAALAQAASAQSQVANDIKTVDADEAALNAALGAPTSSGAPGGGGPVHSPSTTTTTTTTVAPTTTTTVVPTTTQPKATAGGSPGAAGSKARAATTQQLAVDQASIDAAQVNLSNAEQALGDATLVSPITGTVASVTIAPGSSVAAGSATSTPALVVVGSGTSFETVVNVPVTHIGQVAVGQRARVTPDVTGSVLAGTVTSIGALGTTGTTGTTTYPVTVSLAADGLGQYSGADAQVSIVTGSAVDVLTVPSSAIRTVGATHLVSVLSGGTVKRTRVTVGTVGDLLTQVDSGLARGDEVVLADLSQPLPSTTPVTGRFGLGGGLGGAGGAGALRTGGLGGGGTAGGAGG